MKILLIAGHGAGDSGAIGYGYRECDLTREVVSGLEQDLKGYAEIEVYPFDRNAFYDVQNGDVVVNFADYDYVFEVHFNASTGGAYGTEIYVPRMEEQTTAEEIILEHLSPYFYVRGVKRKNFLVIKTVKETGTSSALLETCFIDSANDMYTFENNKEEIIKAIASGIIEGFGLHKEVSDLRYKGHIQDIGWTDWKNEGEILGTTGECKRLEDIIFEQNNGLELEYRVHMEDLGWSDWKKSGEEAGTTGEGRRIEELEINCNKDLEAQEHVQDIGWLPPSRGKHIVLGTQGKALRLEALKIKVM